MEQRLVEVRDALRFAELRSQALSGERDAARADLEAAQRQALAAQERAAASEAAATRLEARAAAAERQVSGQEAVARELTSELLDAKVRGGKRNARRSTFAPFRGVSLRRCGAPAASGTALRALFRSTNPRVGCPGPPQEEMGEAHRQAAASLELSERARASPLSIPRLFAPRRSCPQHEVMAARPRLRPSPPAPRCCPPRAGGASAG